MNTKLHPTGTIWCNYLSILYVCFCERLLLYQNRCQHKKIQVVREGGEMLPHEAALCLPSHIMTSSNGNIFRATGPFVRGIHRSPVNSRHKGQWRGDLMFSLICALNKRLSKQSWRWRFETQSRSLWRHCYDLLWFDAILWYSTNGNRWYRTCMDAFYGWYSRVITILWKKAICFSSLFLSLACHNAAAVKRIIIDNNNNNNNDDYDQNPMYQDPLNP